MKFFANFRLSKFLHIKLILLHSKPNWNIFYTEFWYKPLAKAHRIIMLRFL